ncbi:MAG: glycoside hydrolase family 5 protein [Spirochaetales bacterium]|nr:glycoside hydrolase family 5 protein [Spirochaetales bacterium]
MRKYKDIYLFWWSIILFILIIGTSSCQTPVTAEKQKEMTSSRITEVPFHRGVNLTNWLQTGSSRQIQFTKFTKQDLINIKSLGCDVIRLPINLHAMTNGSPHYTIDPLFFTFLDHIVDWAEELELHLILDNHTFDPAVKTSSKIGDTLVKVWTQMAAHYKDRSTFIYYEVLNEPHGITDKMWNKIQQRVVAEIRKIDQKHTIVVGPAGWNGYNNLKYMPEYKDDNLIYTFHFYDPFLFTHQGASWTDPSLEPLAGVPFPYDPARMPPCPPKLKNTWVNQNLLNYKNDGTVKKVKELIDIAVAFKNKHNVPVFCGELGVFIPNSNPVDRVYWYGAVRRYFEEKDISWTMWDYTGTFGLFKMGTSELFEYDLNTDVIKALGLNPVEQKEFILTPDNTGFDLYNDYIEPKVIESGWVKNGILDFYSETDPFQGKYCIYWTGVDQYSRIGFSFKPIKDLSQLVKEGYAVDFRVRGNSLSAQFDIRFVDTKTSAPGDHPWRIRMVMDSDNVVWDGTWQHIQIPLSSFTEQGSWDNKWFEPRGAFDWTAIDSFEIVAENHALKNIQLWFDAIRIVDPRTVAAEDESSSVPHY